MSRAAIKGAAYCLDFMPEIGVLYGNTPYEERKEHGETEFIKNLPSHTQSYEDASSYPPNMAYIGAISVDDLEKTPQPWYENKTKQMRFGKYGEIMPEDEFFGLMDICDVFDIIWLEKSFAADVRAKLEKHPLLGKAQLDRLEAGHDEADIKAECEKDTKNGGSALPIYLGGKLVGCCRRGHDIDENLIAYVLLENIACKAGGVLSLLHLLKNTDTPADEIDFVIECSEEACGDMNQRGGGNMAKSIAEIAGCSNASGIDVRGFCAGPVNAITMGASLVASGTRTNVAIVAGGAIPKLFMNARDHVKKDLTALEDCLGNFATLVVPCDGVLPEIRLDAVGKHSVAAGASPQAVTTALVYEPLNRIGLGFNDVDKIAAELHIPEITMPAGAGNVPEANYKMVAALAVMKKQLEKSAINDYIKQHGMPGFAHTQGHIPSGVPFVGHAVDAIKEGKMNRVMIIGKGSLFLGRLTNLADGLSFIIEKADPNASSGGATKEEIKETILEALAEIAEKMK